MHHRQSCTVAQLLFRQTPTVNFARLVADLDAACADCPPEGRSLNWDHGDIAVLDIQGARIVLGYEDGLTGEHAACLSVGVGYGPGSGATTLAERQDTASRLIADRIRAILPPDAVVWHHSSRDLTPELLDSLVEALPQVGADQLARDLTRTADMAASRSACAAAAALIPANDQPVTLHPQVEELHRIRAALYAASGAVPQQQVTLRLAAHAMNATLVVIALPVGAAMMTHSLLRGENLHASARLLAIIGLAIGARNLASAGEIAGLF